MTNADQIAPCPACHDDDNEEGAIYDHGPDGVRLQCDCGCCGPWCLTMDEARTEWNRLAGWTQRVAWISAMGGLLMTQGYDYLPDGAVSGVLEWLIYEDELDKAPRGRGVTLEAALDDALAHWRWSDDDGTLVRIRASQPHPALPVAEALEDSRALRAGFLRAIAWVIDRAGKGPHVDVNHKLQALLSLLKLVKLVKPGNQLLEDALIAGADLRSQEGEPGPAMLMCAPCNGTGEVQGESGPEVCSGCNGSGAVV